MPGLPGLTYQNNSPTRVVSRPRQLREDNINGWWNMLSKLARPGGGLSRVAEKLYTGPKFQILLEKGEIAFSSNNKWKRLSLLHFPRAVILDFVTQIPFVEIIILSSPSPKLVRKSIDELKVFL